MRLNEERILSPLFLDEGERVNKSFLLIKYVLYRQMLNTIHPLPSQRKFLSWGDQPTCKHALSRCT